MSKVFKKPPNPPAAREMPDPDDPSRKRDELLDQFRKRRRGRDSTVLSGGQSERISDSYTDTVLGGR